MIFITADTHIPIDITKLNNYNFPEQKDLTKDDFVLILGDFGGVWNNSEEELWWRNWLLKRNFTTLFIDGNHECVSKDTEILTENGWVNVVDVYNSNIKIANFDINTREIFFDYPLNRIRKYKERAILFEGKNTKQLVSFNHDIIINGKKIKAKDLLDKKIRENEFILKGNCKNIGVNISNEMIELLTWVIMNATIVDYSKKPNSQKCCVQFKLSRQDKINNLTQLLNSMNIPYTFKPTKKSITGKLQPYFIRIYSDSARMINNALSKNKRIPLEWRNFNKNQVLIFLNTLIKTDGTQQNYGNEAIVWRSTDIYNTDIVQEFCIKNEFFCVNKIFENMSGFANGKNQNICRIYYNKDLDNFININEVEYNDDMYCFTMPHGTLITRLEGKVAFTGNCFPLLNKFKVQKWNGGKVHFINDSIIHLMRGQVFTINDLTFFTMGGATSIDKHQRIEGKSWWPEEIPSNKEFNEGIKNLEKYNWEVDYVLTHAAPKLIYDKLRYIRDNDPLVGYFDMLDEKLTFTEWFCGHMHDDMDINKYTLLYNRVIKL